MSAVLREAFEPYRPLYTPAAFAATTPPADQLRQRWREGPVWVAVRDDRIVGTVAAVPRANALYERCGFRRTDAGPPDLAGTPLFAMEKMLEWN